MVDSRPAVSALLTRAGGEAINLDDLEPWRRNLPLAAWPAMHLLQLGVWLLAALAIAAQADIYICYRLARPVPGIGILLPGFAAALVAIGIGWLLLSGPAELRLGRRSHLWPECSGRWSASIWAKRAAE